jgi:hypothetical protein
LVPQSLLIGNGRNFFATVSTRPVSHVKLNMFPGRKIAHLGGIAIMPFILSCGCFIDGGIARLELYGTAPAAMSPATEAELEARSNFSFHHCTLSCLLIISFLFVYIALAWVNALPAATGFPVGFKPDLTVETRPPATSHGPAPVCYHTSHTLISMIFLLCLPILNVDDDSHSELGTYLAYLPAETFSHLSLCLFSVP